MCQTPFCSPWKVGNLNDRLIFPLSRYKINIFLHNNTSLYAESSGFRRFPAKVAMVFRHTPNLLAIALFETFSSSKDCISASYPESLSLKDLLPGGLPKVTPPSAFGQGLPSSFGRLDHALFLPTFRRQKREFSPEYRLQDDNCL